MPSLDTENDCFVLKIVYDGASKAGKTTTVRALAELLGVEIQSPHETWGRTLYFDWLEYHGGRYEGRTLRCQVVTVPGQRILYQRRQRLLRDADAVVFVLDSSPAGCAAAAGPLDELRIQLAAASSSASFLVQANKRDRPDALRLEALHERLDLAPTVAIAPTVASRAEGVRETFVLAVRLALERLGAGLDTDKLAVANQHDEDPVKLLAELCELQLTPADPAPANEHRSESSQPRLPDALIPEGHIWPPANGRGLLLEARRETARLESDDGGAWQATSRRWRFRSEARGLFRRREAGLRRLLAWAQWHAEQSSLITPGRILALAPDGYEKAWRLWQVVRAEAPLDVELRRAASRLDFARVDEMLQAAFDWATAARDASDADDLLSRAGLGSLTVVKGRAFYAAFAAGGGADDFELQATPKKSTLIHQIRRFAEAHERPEPADRSVAMDTA